MIVRGSNGAGKSTFAVPFMNEAARAAVIENRAFGLPEIHWIDGQLVYELPDDTRTTEVPEILKRK